MWPCMHVDCLERSVEQKDDNQDSDDTSEVRQLNKAV